MEGIDVVFNKYGFWCVLCIGGWMVRFIYNVKYLGSERRIGLLIIEELIK